MLSNYSRILALGIFVSIANSISAQSVKVVVKNNGRPVGKLIGTTSTQYIIEVQDEGYVPKRGHRVEVWSPKMAKGVVFPAREGTFKVYQQASLQSKVIYTSRFEYADGCPPTFRNLGIVNGFYKIKLSSGKIGYVPVKRFEWEWGDLC